MLISATAAHMLSTREAATIGTTAVAHTSIAVLRAAFTLQPRVINRGERRPPNTLPTSDTSYTTITGGPSSSSDSPNLRLKKSGIRNRDPHKSGSVINSAFATVHVWRWGSNVFQDTRTGGSGGSAAM